MQNISPLTNTPSIITGSYGKFTLNKTFSNESELLDVILLENSGERNRASSLGFNDTGDTFVTTDNSGNIYVFYLDKNRYVHLCKKTNPTAICLSEKQNGLLFLGNTNKAVEVFNLSGKLLHTLKGHKYNIGTLKLNHSRNLLLSCSKDACILWNLTNFKSYKTLHSKSVAFSGACFSPDGDSLITSFADSTLYFWSLSTFEIEKKIPLPKEAKINLLSPSKESKYLAVAGNSSQVYLINLDDESDIKSFSTSAGCDRIKKVNFLSNSHLAILGSDDIFYIVDIEDGFKILIKHSINGKAIISADVDINSKFAGFVTNLGEIYLYDLPKLLQRYQSTDPSNFAINSFDCNL